MAKEGSWVDIDILYSRRWLPLSFALVMISAALNTDGVKVHIKMGTFWFPNCRIMREAMRDLGLVTQSFCSCPLINHLWKMYRLWMNEWIMILMMLVMMIESEVDTNWFFNLALQYHHNLHHHPHHHLNHHLLAQES